jgi:hypothetical protein
MHPDDEAYRIVCPRIDALITESSREGFDRGEILSAILACTVDRLRRLPA